MSDRKITVSDGTNFFLIPISDLDEACADGFYIPALRDRTIVSNGQDIFEIPVADLSDAKADGFYDVLAVELEIVKGFGSRAGTHVRRTAISGAGDANRHCRRGFFSARSRQIATGHGNLPKGWYNRLAT